MTVDRVEDEAGEEVGEHVPQDCGNCGGVFHADEAACPGCGWEPGQD